MDNAKLASELMDTGLWVSVVHSRWVRAVLPDYKTRGYTIPIKRQLLDIEDIRENGWTKYIEPLGGVTTVILTDLLEEQYYKFYAHCHPKECFNRSLGTQIALGRALKWARKENL